jgi:hypothetical protein
MVCRILLEPAWLGRAPTTVRGVPYDLVACVAHLQQVSMAPIKRSVEDAL